MRHHPSPVIFPALPPESPYDVDLKVALGQLTRLSPDTEFGQLATTVRMHRLRHEFPGDVALPAELSALLATHGPTDDARHEADRHARLMMAPHFDAVTAAYRLLALRAQSSGHRVAGWTILSTQDAGRLSDYLCLPESSSGLVALQEPVLQKMLSVLGGLRSGESLTICCGDSSTPESFPRRATTFGFSRRQGWIMLPRKEAEFAAQLRFGTL